MKKFTFLVAALCATMMASATVFEKVTTAPADWSGQYLIVYENSATEAYVFNGQDAANGYVSASIADGKIESTELDNYVATIAPMTGGYSVKIAEKYYGGKSGSNSLEIGTTAVLNTLSMKADTVLLTSNTSVMRFNKAKDQKRFRYFKAASYAIQSGICLYKATTAVEDPVVEEISVSKALELIDALADNGVTVDNYILSGVVSELDLSTEFGNATFTLTDASGSGILIYRAYNIGNQKFTDAAQLANGDTVKVFGQLKKYVKDAVTTPELVKGYLLDRKTTGEEGGGSEGGEEGGEGELDYSFEPTEVTTIDETMLKADWTDYTIDGLVLVWLGNEQYEVSLAVLTTKAAMPVGTFEINDSEAENTVLASPGGDETDDYPSFVAADFEGDVYNAAYYLVSGNVTISVAEDVYTIKLDAKSYNGSTIKMAYTGAVEEYTAIRTVEIDNTVYARDGRIYAEEGARIYSLTGLDVTRMNGNLEGIYIVKNGNKVAKVAVAK